MQINEQLASAFTDQSVLVTGHTGFKGAWLCEWLLMLGAKVTGVALSPNTTPSLFEEIKLEHRVSHNILDIRDRKGMKELIADIQPNYIFHLAAQPLVRLSYEEPVETYETNVIGTVHLLDALRNLNNIYKLNNRKCSAVLITTDKCYENREWLNGYREDDHLGGYDPYSSSKAAAEVAISSYRRSFMNPAAKTAPNIGIASARAGNVIGGGDWALDRIVPDTIRSLQAGESIPVRNAVATRPWQHVLEPLSGYLSLAALQMRALQAGDKNALLKLSDAFNFGPALTANRSVKVLVEQILKLWPGEWTDYSREDAVHEAGKLNLVWDKAFHLLSWEPRWQFEETLEKTICWYKSWSEKTSNARTLVRNDITSYENSGQ